MKVFRGLIKWAVVLVSVPILYILISLILTFIPANKTEETLEKNNSIYITSNGVHLDLILHEKDVDPIILDGLIYTENEDYFSFGWGEKIFYMNTPSWNDLTIMNSFRALFLKNSAMIHLTRYSSFNQEWVEIKVNQNQLHKINQYIYQSFSVDSLNKKTLLPDKGYSNNDDFYDAEGRFSCFKTCNTWVNTGLKESDIDACLWTPFDFGLLSIHKKQAIY